MKKLPTILLLSLLLLPFAVQAGFGITPPYVKNASLTRASHYEQKIILVRSDPVEDLTGEITVDLPKAKEWLTVDKGMSFTLPKGEQQFPIVVKVDIPKDADFGTYKGNMRIRVAAPPQRGVGIALGAQIDVEIGVIDKQIVDFRIQKVDLADASEGRKFLWLFFPGKVKFGITLLNTGNVPSSPARVEMDIYDNQGQKIQEQTKNSGSIEKIEPFLAKQVMAYLPTRLKTGSYLAKYRIFKQDLIAQEGELSLSVMSYGSIKDDPVYGLDGLPLRDQLILGVIAVLFLVSLYLLFRMIRKKNKRNSSHNPPPPAPGSIADTLAYQDSLHDFAPAPPVSGEVKMRRVVRM
jgi:hypothetical protein